VAENAVRGRRRRGLREVQAHRHRSIRISRRGHSRNKNVFLHPYSSVEILPNLQRTADGGGPFAKVNLGRQNEADYLKR
jgi:hypothetical protein